MNVIFCLCVRTQACTENKLIVYLFPCLDSLFLGLYASVVGISNVNLNNIIKYINNYIEFVFTFLIQNFYGMPQYQFNEAQD